MATTDDDQRIMPGFAVAAAVVKNNLDLISEGRVQVRIPTVPALEPWARLAAPGGASSRGLLWVPQIDDEVLVAFEMNDPASAYVLGGLWSTVNRPPLMIPTDFITRRVIRTGVTSAVGHEVEFDDAMQSIKINSSTKQSVTIDPLKIQLSNTAGTLTITMDNTQQSISIQAVAKIELKAAQIAIEGVSVEIKGATVSINSAGPCTVQGLPIKLN
jgi:uncharacterized protein involved in type VI secretion and phage assembly